MFRRTLMLIQSGQSFTRNCRSIFTSACQRKQQVDDDSDMWFSSTPILKNMFVGHFNIEIFDFPSIEDQEELDDLHKISDAVETFMKEEVDSKAIDRESKIPQETMDGMKRLGLFGLEIPSDYGGLGLNASHRALIAEYTGLDGGISATLLGHGVFGVKGLLLAGNEEQKRKYLPKLASGEWLAALCLSEPGSGCDIQSIEAKAVLSEDGTHYRLTGTKSWILNGGVADLFIVFAKCQVTRNGDPVDRVTAFIVERNFGGVQSSPNDGKLGLRGANSCTVTFDDTRVPRENLLGEAGEGFKLAMRILAGDRFAMGSGGAGLIKLMLKGAVEHVLTRQQFGRPLADFQLIQAKIAKMTTHAYVMESMSYLTAGLKDRIEDADFLLEEAAVKIFSSEATFAAADECIQIHGGMGCSSDHPYERFLRDTRALALQQGTNSLLRMLIGGQGLQHAGQKLKTTLNKIVKPERYLTFSLKRSAEIYNCRFRDVEQSLQFEVHSDLAPIMDEMSKHANHFRYIVPELLSLYGRAIIEEQILISELVDNVIDMYAVCATVSRATQSLFLDRPTADHERTLAYAFGKEALPRIYARNMRVSLMYTEGSAAEMGRIANTMMKNQGYAAEHPLTRNW